MLPWSSLLKPAERKFNKQPGAKKSNCQNLTLAANFANVSLPLQIFCLRLLEQRNRGLYQHPNRASLNSLHSMISVTLSGLADWIAIKQDDCDSCWVRHFLVSCWGKSLPGRHQNPHFSVGSRLEDDNFKLKNSIVRMNLSVQLSQCKIDKGDKI